MPARPKSDIKVCSRCKQAKDRRRDFAIDKRRPDAVVSWCYACMSEHSRHYYRSAVGHARTLARMARWRKHHPEYQFRKALA